MIINGSAVILPNTHASPIDAPHRPRKCSKCPRCTNILIIFSKHHDGACELCVRCYNSSTPDYNPRRRQKKINWYKRGM